MFQKYTGSPDFQALDHTMEQFCCIPLSSGALGQPKTHLKIKFFGNLGELGIEVYQ